MNTRLAELSRTIDAAELGRRIRNARVAAGLTQGDIAADDVTSAYVSRIEDGQRRPEFGLLGRMAQRMGVSLEQLLVELDSPARLESLVALDHAELALVGGDSRAALEQVERLTTTVSKQEDDLHRRMRLIRAGALEALGDLNQAIVILEELSASPTPSIDWLKTLIALSRCYREVGDFDRAIAAGDDARASIEELDLSGSTESIQLSITVASAHMMRGDLDRGMQICLKAIEHADAVKSPTAKASAYWNASLIESRRGAAQNAFDLAQKALAYFEIGEDNRNLARLRGHVADMQLEMDPPDAQGAIDTLERALGELAWSSGSAVDRASQLQTRARAHLLLTDLEAANADIEASLELLPPEATIERAYGLSTRGSIAVRSGDIPGAENSFLAAVHILSAHGADREAAQLWYELGDQLKALGLTEAALDAMTRAAASTGLRATSKSVLPTSSS